MLGLVSYQAGSHVTSRRATFDTLSLFNYGLLLVLTQASNRTLGRNLGPGNFTHAIDTRPYFIKIGPGPRLVHFWSVRTCGFYISIFDVSKFDVHVASTHLHTHTQTHTTTPPYASAHAHRGIIIIVWMYVAKTPTYTHTHKNTTVIITIIIVYTTLRSRRITPF